jgi:anthranilate synthase/aminodeoxychorismate synthase-like glutamine amidotransferase
VILLIDNYDSFVFNLARLFEELGCETEVVRNDRITVDEVLARWPEAVVLSPGPCTPNEAGVCLDLVRQLPAQIPLLGICLGHQAIAQAYGAKIVRAPEPVHGQTSEVVHDGRGLYRSLPSPLTVGRYHSLVIDEPSLPSELEITGRTANGLIMSIEHQVHPISGVQFHPESILTRGGVRLLANFLVSIGRKVESLPVSELPVDVVDEGDDYYRQPITTPGVAPWP